MDQLLELRHDLILRASLQLGLATKSVDSSCELLVEGDLRVPQVAHDPCSTSQWRAVDQPVFPQLLDGQVNVINELTRDAAGLITSKVVAPGLEQALLFCASWIREERFGPAVDAKHVVEGFSSLGHSPLEAGILVEPSATAPYIELPGPIELVDPSRPE